MTAIPTNTLRNVLEKIEEMNLPEGEYLTLANLLKSQHKKDEPVGVSLVINAKVKFVGKKTYTIEIHKRIRYNYPRTDEIEYSVNGVRKTEFHYVCYGTISRLYMANLTKKMLIGEDELEITMKEFATQFRETDAVLRDPRLEDVINDNDDIDYVNYEASDMIKELFGINM